MSIKSLQRKAERQLALEPPANDLEKIRQWYYQQETQLLAHDKDRMIILSPQQETARKRYAVVFGWMVNGLTTSQIVKKIRATFELNSDRFAYEIIRNTKDLYGDMHEVHKQSLRTIQIDRRRRLVQKIKNDTTIEAADKYKLIHLYEERIEKLGGLDDPDAVSFKEILDALRMPDVQYSDDPKTLEAGYEDVTDSEQTS